MLLINSLEGGGAEKVMARLAAEFSTRFANCEVHLALLDSLPDAYAPPADVVLHRLDCKGSLITSVFETRKLFQRVKPDYVLSFLTRANCAAVLARRTHSFRCVISERVHTTSHLGTGFRARLQRGIVGMLYPRADAVVAVSQGVADELGHKYNVLESKLVTIHNPVDLTELQQKAALEPEIQLPKDFFVSVGRLVPNKGCEALLRAFAAHKNKKRYLVMLGEGPDRAKLVALANQLGISDRIVMPGYVDNPHAIVGRATAYVSASRSEGFPNALLEAMALSRPIAVSDCHAGPAEILAQTRAGEIGEMTQARWGILFPVDDIQAITAAMDDLDDQPKRTEFEHKSLTRAKSFSTRSVVDDYVRVLVGSGPR
ncbi:glycosyltransferase [Shimia sediminis]|uniref:glycosyltransferase n=1 Tax=Shimia sediminis TaxID=2497945 RepID=UPI000F8F1AFB|nr:glycosyltransferase [Shimia sediminis]